MKEHRHKKRAHSDGPYPIETLSPSDGFVLVYGDQNAHNPAGQPVVLARKNGDLISPMYTSGGYCGAKWWRPVPELGR